MKGMQKIGLLALFTVTAALLPSQAFARVNLIFDINPGNMIMSRDVDNLQVSKVIGATRFIDKVEGGFGWIPTMKVGAGLETEKMYIDGTVGVGGLINAAAMGPMTMLDAAFRYRLSDKLTVGPHMSYVRYSPSWIGEYSDSDDLDFKVGKGVIYGIGVTLGKTVAFTGSVDYLSMSPLKVTTHNGWSANRSEINVSGWMMQLGVAFRFFRGR